MNDGMVLVLHGEVVKVAEWLAGRLLRELVVDSEGRDDD